MFLLASYRLIIKSVKNSANYTVSYSALHKSIVKCIVSYSSLHRNDVNYTVSYSSLHKSNVNYTI